MTLSNFCDFVKSRAFGVERKTAGQYSRYHPDVVALTACARVERGVTSQNQ